MATRYLPVVALAALLATAAPGHAENFLSEIDDLPLMPGLRERPSAGLLFDTPAGRIAESHAEGAVAADRVIAFYAATLPELGWVAVGPQQYRRDHEALRIEVAVERGATRVRFIVTPAAAP